jgi:predicted DNA-binding transcriptional regulator AlpA
MASVETIPLRPVTPSAVEPQTAPAVEDPNRLIRQRDLFVNRMAVSMATGHRLTAAGKIGPRPIRVGSSVRYFLPEVLAWLAHRRPDGQLHDRHTWSAVWTQLQRGGNR